MAKLEIPVRVYMGELEEIINELKHLQTYKLFDGDDTVLIDCDEVVKIFANHLRAEVRSDSTVESDLSSAQQEPIRINLNESIKVKLTDWGKEIYCHQHDRINQIAGREVCKPSFPKEDENGYTEFQLWCFMELYGEHIGMTLPNIIEPLEIVYERRTG